MNTTKPVYNESFTFFLNKEKLQQVGLIEPPSGGLKKSMSSKNMKDDDGIFLNFLISEQ